LKPSLRPSRAPQSEAHPDSRRFIDSGARIFLGGLYYYRQIGDLAINLCVAASLSDEAWREYLYGSLAVARELGRGPSVSMITFAHAHPNAGQRRFSAQFMAAERVRPIERVAVLSESELLRGAMTAFGWLVPSLKYRAFRTSDAASAFSWLREIGEFDVEMAMSAWNDAVSKLDPL
jgi:hypothetical protein